MGVLPLDSLVALVRLRIYEAVTIEGFDLVDANYIANEIDADVTSSFVKMAFRQLNASSELEYDVTKSPVSGEVRTGKVWITAKGIKKVEQDLANPDAVAFIYQEQGLDGIGIPFVSTNIAPAADRLVSYSDNQVKADQARRSVAILRERIEQANELPEELESFRDVVLIEITMLQSLVEQAILRSSIVLTFARKLLPWIIEKAGSAAVGELAKKALAALISWLS